MQGECSEEHPNDSGPSSEDDKGTADRTSSVRLHVIGSDGVVALVRVSRQWYDKRKLGDLAGFAVATLYALTSINMTPIVRHTLR